jgi:hypothetical protein
VPAVSTPPAIIPRSTTIPDASFVHPGSRQFELGLTVDPSLYDPHRLNSGSRAHPPRSIWFDWPRMRYVPSRRIRSTSREPYATYRPIQSYASVVSSS